MERLTKRVPGGIIFETPIGNLLDRLAAYEDTGLEPEEIEDRQDVCLWIPEERFSEIIRAEADGRLVVPPKGVE